jgi:hypothetical protein
MIGPTFGSSRPDVLMGVLVIVLGVGPSVLAAQTFQGRVLDVRDERAISTAVVRVLDPDGETVAVTIADSTGFYRVVTPGPGVYRLEALRLGFHRVESPLLDAAVAGGTYPIDLLMTAAPVELPGFTVETDRISEEQFERGVRFMVGLNPISLRAQPIRSEALLNHAERGHDITDVVRWGNSPGIVTMETTDGPCFKARNRSCLPVYLNGQLLNLEIVDLYPVEMLEAVVLLYPNESIAYPGGAVLMYTEAWLR